MLSFLLCIFKAWQHNDNVNTGDWPLISSHGKSGKMQKPLFCYHNLVGLLGDKSLKNEFSKLFLLVSSSILNPAVASSTNHEQFYQDTLVKLYNYGYKEVFPYADHCGLIDDILLLTIALGADYGSHRFSSFCKLSAPIFLPFSCNKKGNFHLTCTWCLLIDIL